LIIILVLDQAALGLMSAVARQRSSAVSGKTFVEHTRELFDLSELMTDDLGNPC
jgi:hypothetical protein